MAIIAQSQVTPARVSPPGTTMDPSEIYAKTELGLQEIRERKLNLPITLRTRIRLLIPRTPGRRAHAPRTINSMVTPACEAR